MGRVRQWLRKPVVIGVLGCGALLAGAAAYWFQPWKLWQDRTVREAASADTRTLATGSLISHEHTTSGSVRILQAPDGSRTLRLEGLATSNGPDVKVLLSDAPVKPGRAGWHVFDDGAHVGLGSLKGNKGDQNYALPEGLDLDKYTSVSIWCDRFDVSFGATALTKA
ncbi:DM13 domain-containing protein [Streptomyces sp. AV19]|uniref:DM13 domain-containing protein n=1 Tax=Streptomyces sp. AV19 TaxID=2793068 RepID=UPI0018FED606|nr:DM13 domain-containing protein [Streptomyces sp. AV19]MBH1938498.1 DM13 domain-containing protein [Streptomyces sp. AV19]MDG4535147.1 DM13 domain-containing protein [Streptomyces sp. AV19]